ncbi:SGNH hydrolase-type esterase domain-containing protein [Aspergillus terricola var. indicus]
MPGSRNRQQGWTLSGGDGGKNSDTRALIAVGVFFSMKAGRTIPLPELREEPSGATIKATCIRYDDYLPDLLEPAYRVDGYVAFGDSYSAGMGTGSTLSGPCRVGSNNYLQLLFEKIGEVGVKVENKMCSGDTTIGLARQIREWSSASTATIATLTIGGNDLGFSDLVRNCVITPNTAHFGSYYRQKCIEAEDKARAPMQDTGAQGLRSKLKEAYKCILTKSSMEDFHLFVTSYIGFFNHDTTDGDKSTFHYWWASYKPSPDWWVNRIVYLTTRDLRRELNDLVDQLNNVIQDAVDYANSEHGGSQVHYVNVQEKFKPPEHVFLLSGWNDLPPEGNAAKSSEAEERAALIDAGGIDLPDPATCTTALGTDPVPYAVAKCRASIAVEEDLDGPWAESYRNATEAISQGGYNSQHITWWLYMRQIKTFHPRTQGMGLYRDAILEAIKNEIN